MDVRVGLWRKLSAKELMLLNLDVGEDFESPLDSKEIQPVYPKGNQPWIFIGRTDAEAETPILCPPDVKNWLTGKTLMLGKMKAGGEGDNRGWDGWMASLTQWTWVQLTPGVGDGQGSLVCCSPWGHKESDTTEWLNWLMIEYISKLKRRDKSPMQKNFKQFL